MHLCAIQAYRHMADWRVASEPDLLAAHHALVLGPRLLLECSTHTGLAEAHYSHYQIAVRQIDVENFT